MDDTPHHKHSTSALGIAGWLVLLIVTAGGMWQLHQEITAVSSSAQPDAALAEIKAQGEIIAALKTEIEQLRQSSPAADTTVALTETNTQLAAIAQRLAALEAAKSPPQPAPTNTTPLRLLFSLEGKLLRGTPYSEELEALALLPQLKDDTDAITALRAFATQGAPTELKLRNDFNAIVNKQDAPVDSKTAETINSRLSGLVTIKRRTATPDHSLNNVPPETPIAAMVEKINALPADARAPFADWLSAVAATEKAVQASATLQNKLLPIQ
jgi:hypothetical protein